MITPDVRIEMITYHWYKIKSGQKPANLYVPNRNLKPEWNLYSLQFLHYTCGVGNRKSREHFAGEFSCNFFSLKNCKLFQQLIKWFLDIFVLFRDKYFLWAVLGTYFWFLLGRFEHLFVMGRSDFRVHDWVITNLN